MGIEWLKSRSVKAEAHLRGFVAAVASRHMDYLHKALDDPLKYGPDREDLGYLTIVHDVKRNGTPGKLLTAPGQIEYFDSSGSIQICCTSIHSAGGENELRIVYDETRSPNASQKRRTLVIQAGQRIDRQMLLGDVYLACPNLLK
jgi:hypothetical protein